MVAHTYRDGYRWILGVHRQPSLLGEFQASERAYLKKKKIPR